MFSSFCGRNEEVFMTTKLSGKNTFLPFNKAIVNPVNKEGQSSYYGKTYFKNQVF